MDSMTVTGLFALALVMLLSAVIRYGQWWWFSGSRRATLRDARSLIAQLDAGRAPSYDALDRLWTRRRISVLSAAISELCSDDREAEACILIERLAEDDLLEAGYRAAEIAHWGVAVNEMVSVARRALAVFPRQVTLRVKLVEALVHQMRPGAALEIVEAAPFDDPDLSRLRPALEQRKSSVKTSSVPTSGH